MPAKQQLIPQDEKNKKPPKPAPWFSKAHQDALLHTVDLSREIFDWLGDHNYERVSIGQLCVSAHYIRTTASRQPPSYPFDWIGSTPETILHILKDDFKMFLDKNMMYSTQKNGMGQDQAGHRFYAKDIYFHMDPLKSEKAYRYLKLSVRRFQKLFKGQKPIVFVTTVIKELEKNPTFRDGWIHHFKISDNYSIKDYLPVIEYAKSINPNVKFFFLEQYTEQEIQIEKTYQDDNAFWVRFDSKGRNYGTKYVDNLDDAIAKILFKALI